VWVATEGRLDVTWLTDVSLLAAPWLLLAFLAGWTQRAPRAGALLGMACTQVAIAGYGVMTLSPIEGAELTRQSIALRPQPAVLHLRRPHHGPPVRLVRKPLAHRPRPSGPLVVAGAFCLEPVARLSTGYALRVPAVGVAEVAVGFAILAYVVWTTRATPAPPPLASSR
jgi:hypothetical protein